MTYYCPFGLDALCRDVHLQRVGLGILRVPEVENLVQQLIHQHKVVLHSLLIELAKVGLAQAHEPIEELKDQGGIRVTLGHRHEVDVLVLDMAEGGRAKCEDGRAHLGVGNDLYAEDVGEARAAVVAEGAKDEILTLLIEYEDSGQHGGGRSAGRVN